MISRLVFAGDERTVRRAVAEALAAESERFGENDLASILDHLGRPHLTLLRADERYSAQPSTGAWKEFGQ